ncbi:DUF3073 domain-containing protein [Dactylosporangium sp. NPDC005555]|uniref:DUF3073 domain-containing protein n=1 Tax=Dactylosporangium sp. NPDC005555 TaxID=3154889 RepID=UPI0033B695C3
MGRGRAKAKQTRIARELKYFTPPTDLTALQHELAGVHLPEPEDADSSDYTPDRDDRTPR